MLPFYTSIPQESMVGLECVAEFDCPKGEEWDGPTGALAKLLLLDQFPRTAYR